MGNVMMEASQINYRGGETKMSVEQALKETSGEAAAIAALQAAVGNLQTGKADLPVIAPEFDAETGVYAVGDLVMYQGKLYEFTTAHETAGDWDSTEVTEKTVSDEIDSLKSGLTNLIKTETKDITIDSGENKVAMLGINTPNVVLNISIAGLIILGYSTYQNQWLCVIADYDGTIRTSGTYTATIYYI